MSVAPVHEKGSPTPSVSSQYSEPTSVIYTLFSAGKEKILGPVNLQAGKTQRLSLYSKSTWLMGFTISMKSYTSFQTALWCGC